MRPSWRSGSKTAAFLATLLLVGTAAAVQASPAAPAAAPQIHKMTIYNGSVPTVSYSVEGGSPHLQALVQKLQFTENEINLTDELQALRLNIVANEQTLDAVRTSQQLGLGPIGTQGSADCAVPPESALKKALVPGLAGEATPAAAYELINLREQIQTAMQAEQGKPATPVSGQPPANPNALPAGTAAVPWPQATAPLAASSTPGQQFSMAAAGVPAQSAWQALPVLRGPQDLFAFQQAINQQFTRVQQALGDQR